MEKRQREEGEVGKEWKEGTRSGNKDVRKWGVLGQDQDDTTRVSTCVCGNGGCSLVGHGDGGDAMGVQTKVMREGGSLVGQGDGVAGDGA